MYNALHIWLSTLSQLAITFSSYMHAHKKALWLYEGRPSNPETKGRHRVLVPCHNFRTVPLITYLQLLWLLHLLATGGFSLLHFNMSMLYLIDMTLQKWAIFIMGVYGENSHFLSFLTEILILVIEKTLTHYMNVSATNNKL